MLEIKKVEYFNIKINSNAGDAHNLLSMFAGEGISLLAFKAVPAEENRTLFSLFPNNSSKMIKSAKKASLNIEGPFTALIIKSNSDEPGECADIFNRLAQVEIKVYEASGIADIKNSYGVILYLNEQDCEKALRVLQ